MSTLKRTPLYETHRALGARIVEFGGWEMPVQYSGILDEHHAVRNAAGLFDIDHMGQIDVSGPDALAFLEHMLTARISNIQLNQAGYAILCYKDGTVVDDTFVYKLAEDTGAGPRYMVVVNASNREKDLTWLRAHCDKFQVQLRDISDEYYMLAFQGPKAEQVLQNLGWFGDVASLKYHQATAFKMQDKPGIIARTGYTGEDGFELFVPNEFGKTVWDAILSAGKDEGVKPIGLGARDSLRFEAKMALYGHEIDAHVTPIEAGLGWACDLTKEFMGRDCLLKRKLEGGAKKLVGFEMIDRAVPRKDCEIVYDGRTLGAVTTGMFSPTLQKNIGLAYVPPELGAVGTEFQVVVRGKPYRARVIKTPFYANRAKGK